MAGPPMAAAGQWSLRHAAGTCRVIAAGYSGTEQLTVIRATRLDSRHAAKLVMYPKINTRRVP